MNTFCEHHQNGIKFGYRCFDRILLNGLIQPFQQPERFIGFFNAYRQGSNPSPSGAIELLLGPKTQWIGSDGAPSAVEQVSVIGIKSEAHGISVPIVLESFHV
jgi:hypothetical protein